MPPQAGASHTFWSAGCRWSKAKTGALLAANTAWKAIAGQKSSIGRIAVPQAADSTIESVRVDLNSTAAKHRSSKVTAASVETLGILASRAEFAEHSGQRRAARPFNDIGELQARRSRADKHWT